MPQTKNVGEKFGCEKKLEKNGLGKIWHGKLDVCIHIFVGVIFHLLPQHLSFGKLQCRIQSVMSSKLSWWLEWAPIQVLAACHIKWDPCHRKSDPTRLNFPCPSLKVIPPSPTDVIRDQCRIFLHVFHSSPIILLQKKRHPDTLLQCWPIITSGCDRPKKPSKHQKKKKKKTKNKKIQSSGTTAPCFGGDDVMIWMIWKFTHFFGWKREKKLWVSRVRRQHTY